MARTKDEFTQTPWTTRQPYVIDSIPFNRQSQKSMFYTRRLNTEQQLYLYNINTKEELDLKLIPDTLSETYSPKIVSVTPFGVVTPLNFYTGGNAKTVSFAFKMHEDIQNENGSVYALVKKLENMAKPVYRGARLFDPLVYFQLGDQFIGMGHITTNFAYEKPFRNGRYTMVDVSMSFTFHEQFADDPIVFNDTYTAELSPFALESDIIENNSFVGDLIQFQTDPDYFVTQIFAGQKFKTYFNTVVTSQNEYILETLNTGWDKDSRIQFIDGLEASTIDPLAEGEQIEASNYFSNPFALDIINLFFNLKEVMYSTRSASLEVFIEQYNNLQAAVNNLRDTYETSYNPILVATENGTSTGWYEKQTFLEGDPNPLQSVYVQMSDTEKTSFEELLDFFENIVIAQINLYESLRGAGN